MNGMWIAIMVISIVAITSVTRVLRAKYNAQHGIIENRKGDTQLLARPADGALQREVETLRERIRVLERIATDEHQPRKIAAEIESLRDR